MNGPLVSVPVITYNSAKYIIDGLESVKAQTYKNIELIISDDCSTDNTVEICQKWLEENKDSFKRAILVSTPHNIGVAGNLNNAIRNCRGEWFKPLSGDDKFLPYTIDGYVNYILKHPEANICFAPMRIIGNSNSIYRIKEFYLELFKQIRNPQNQYRRYVKNHYIPGPGLIYRKDLWKEVGGFNENYPFYEEYPFTLAVLKAGHKVHYIERELYCYNVREDSLSNSKILNYHFFKDMYRFFIDKRIWEMIRNGYILQAFDEYSFLNLTNEKYLGDGYKIKIFIAKMIRGLSPLAYINKVTFMIKRFKQILNRNHNLK